MPSKPEINASTKNFYQNNFFYLRQKYGTHNVPEMLKHIQEDNKVKNTTKLNYCNTIIGLQKHHPGIVKGDLKQLIEYRDQLNQEKEAQTARCNVTEKQKKVLEKITYEQLVKAVQDLAEYKQNSIRDMEDYLLLALMVAFKLRNDLVDVVIYQTKTLPKSHYPNYIILPPKGLAQLVIGEHKTSKTNGEIHHQLDQSFTDDIRWLVKQSPRTHLFVSPNARPLTNSAFVHRMFRLTKRLFGQEFSSTVIRKIYLTSEYKDTIDKMKKDAKDMGHSFETQVNHYVKNN